jgi:hypothetical protein
VLICGSREWKDRALIRELIVVLPPGTLIIEGGCEGADLIAGEEGRNRGLPVAEMKAAWHCYGNGGGPIRNQWMLDYLSPTELHAFHDDLEHSRGTRDMWDRADRAGVPCELHDHAAEKRSSGGSA